MLLKSIRSQTHYIMQKRLTILTWYIVCGLVIANLIHNIIVNGNQVYISEMYDMAKIVTLSDWSKSGYFFMIYYPFLVVLPTASVLLDDRNSGMQFYLLGRMDRRNYYIGKTIAVFISTFLIFTLPFLLELLTEFLCFHVNSNGDPSNISYYQTAGEVTGYIWPGLYLKSKVLYVFVMTVMFGAVSGILAVFNFAVSAFRIFKYKIFTLISVYLLMYIFVVLGRFVNGYTTNYMFILRLFDSSPKNCCVYGTVLLAMLVISAGIISFKIKKDDCV